MWGMMTRPELEKCLRELGLPQVEAADLLSINHRTMRRYLEDPSQMPGPTEQALRAWQRLQRLGLPWRPDGVAVLCEDQEEWEKQIALYRKDAVDLDAVLDRVKKRGGPAARWKVDLSRHRASFGDLWITFYDLPNGGFSPMQINLTLLEHENYAALIEDGIACIAETIAKPKSASIRKT